MKKIPLKEKICYEAKKQGLTMASVARLANIQSGDFYQAINGKKSFFPAWRKRVSDILKIPENDLFLNTGEYELCECPTCKGTGKILK